MKDFYEHIDEYMEGSLSPIQVAEFEAEIKRDSSLELAVNNYHDAKKLSEGLLELDMMESLGKLEEEDSVAREKISEDNSETKKSAGRKWFLLLGLVGILLLGALWLSKDGNSGLDKEMILASYERPVNADATRSIDTVGMNSFEKGKFFFALNRFEDSEQWLKEYVTIEKNINLLSQAYYWLGAAHLEQWEVDEAKKAWGKSGERGVKRNMGLLK